jgi:SulP family sulfate permease
LINDVVSRLYPSYYGPLFIAVAAGQVPEVTSYALLAGVSPILALQATWIMGVITALFGGRPGIINGATAASAVASINLVNSDGVDYLFYAIMLAGLLQIGFGVLQLGKLLRFVPYSAMVGFVNAMALIMIFAQLKFLKVPGVGVNASGTGEERGVYIGNHANYYSVLYGSTPWIDLTTLSVMLIEAGLTLTICILFPKMTKIIPGTFLALSFVTILEWSVARQVGFPGTLVRDFAPIETPSMPRPIFMDSTYSVPPLNFDTFKKIWPTAIAMFAVTTVENLLAFRVVGDKTETKGSSNRMVVGQGLAQFVSAILGGMGGGAQLGQSIVNYKSGGVTCLSNFFAGSFLFLILAGAYPAVGIVPLGAVIGIMLYAVSFVRLLFMFVLCRYCA